MILVLFTALITIVVNAVTAKIDIDPLGYIAYCPCMGRFGNQADHFLGALGFANGLNRTLILPPWVEYRYGEPRSMQIPFDTYFKVESLQKQFKVILMHEFMETIAPYEWPPERRISFCYMSRGSDNSCNAKEGNPFGPFWDTFSIDFVGSEFYGPLHYDTYHHDMAQKWNDRYPPAKWPVLAFSGAPASFPVQQENRRLQQYLEWSDPIAEEADRFIRTALPAGAFIGIHLRNGIDWVRACEHIPQSPSLFAAPQCVGYRNERGVATRDMCLPSKETVVRQLKRALKGYSGERAVRSVFVASDSNHMLEDLSEALRRMRVRVVRYEGRDPHVDLAVLGRANHFIGNCVSSFSAFVKRERDVKGFPSTFWAFPQEKGGGGGRGAVHDEF